MSLADITITEAGFGSDMGALKFLDIKCGLNDIYPNLIIVNATIRSMKYHGEGNLENGLKNLEYHILNMKKFNDNVLVILNKFNDDTEEEIKIVENFCNSLNTEMLLSEMYTKGSKDTELLVEKILEYVNKENTKTCNIYDINENIIDKIDKYCKNIFGASEVVYKDNLKEELANLDEKFQHYKICISKTPASISDNAKVLGYPKDFTMTVTDYKINNGAGFITILMGNVITMPGLSKTSNYLNIDVENNEIIGIF
jgi:formate--tetrahydrofolate ligase